MLCLTYTAHFLISNHDKIAYQLAKKVNKRKLINYVYCNFLITHLINSNE